jgi:(p)ppGpp synthase/HD superfamily hydrolase
MNIKKPLFLINILCYNLLKNIKNDQSIKFYKIKDIKVQSRCKSIEKIIYKSYVKKKIPKDLFGVRIIYDHEDENISYNILSNIERNFNIINSTKKDYIANPKKNGYQSLHLHISYFNLPFEIQIRNTEMDWRNNYGSANEYNLIKEIILHKIFNKLYFDIVYIQYFLYLILFIKN